LILQADEKIPQLAPVALEAPFSRKFTILIIGGSFPQVFHKLSTGMNRFSTDFG
jgi:hypothetical protein